MSHIVQVFSGSPAEGELQRGDILLAINNTDASGLSHIAAEQQIKSAGGELQLRIKRLVCQIRTLLVNDRGDNSESKLLQFSLARKRKDVDMTDTQRLIFTAVPQSAAANRAC